MTIERDQTRTLVELKQARLYELQKQQALFGPLTPPHISIEINQLTSELAELQSALGRVMVRSSVLPEEQPAPAVGLILLIGTGQIATSPLDQSAKDAIQYHLPALKHCWLIGTAGEHGSLATAQHFATFCQAQQVAAYVWQVEDPMNFAATQRLVDWIYSYQVPEQGLTEQDVIADVTGATKPMTIGMALACGDKRPLQYMVRRPSGPSQPLLLRFPTD